MLKKMRKLLKGNRGQGLVEYILIIALVAVLAIAVLRGFGGKIGEWFNRAENKLDQAIPEN